jgi:hypothetical protein
MTLAALVVCLAGSRRLSFSRFAGTGFRDCFVRAGIVAGKVCLGYSLTGQLLDGCE